MAPLIAVVIGLAVAFLAGLVSVRAGVSGVVIARTRSSASRTSSPAPSPGAGARTMRPGLCSRISTPPPRDVGPDGGL